MAKPIDPLATPVQFEAEFVSAIRDLFEHRIPFNAWLRLQIEEIGAERVRGCIDMRADLVGHFLHNRIHGGVIAACLDAMGGLAVMAAIGARHLDEPPLQRLHRFSRLGTIDMRIDFLRQGIGERFLMEAEVLRLGSRVASTRMSFLDVEGKLLATSAAAYIVS